MPLLRSGHDGKHFPLFPSLVGAACDLDVAISLFHKEHWLVSDLEDLDSEVENNFPRENCFFANYGNSAGLAKKL